MQLNNYCDETSAAAQHQHRCSIPWLHGHFDHPNMTCAHSNNKDTGGDVWYPDTYMGINPHPVETIFFKTNRGITPSIIQRMTDWYYRRSL